MPSFHCPLGAPYYESEDCILCELCAATTKEEMIESTRKIREYLKTKAVRQGPCRKIAVCGKGGAGKSTLVTLMAQVLQEDHRVLVIDMDESNACLARMLGAEKEPEPLITLLARFSEGQRPDRSWLGKEIQFSDIPEQYVIHIGNITLIVAGKISEPLQGCACTMVDIARELMGNLVTAQNEVVLADMEAGIESFGRGMERNADTVLIVVEPSFESVALAGKIAYMAEGMGVSRVRAILNKVTSESVERKLVAELERKDVVSLGTVYVDDAVAEVNFEGKALGTSPAKEQVRRIVASLLSGSSCLLEAPGT